MCCGCAVLPMTHAGPPPHHIPSTPAMTHAAPAPDYLPRAPVRDICSPNLLHMPMTHAYDTRSTPPDHLRSHHTSGQVSQNSGTIRHAGWASPRVGTVPPACTHVRVSQHSGASMPAGQLSHDTRHMQPSRPTTYPAPPHMTHAADPPHHIPFAPAHDTSCSHSDPCILCTCPTPHTHPLTPGFCRCCMPEILICGLLVSEHAYQNS